MRWELLPPELLAHALTHLSLSQLRLLKAVSRATASTCRRVLRSEAWWYDGPLRNRYDMEEELKTQCSSYKLPMTVSMFHDDFPEGRECIATVHKLKLGRMDKYGDFSDTKDAEQCWTGDRLFDKSTSTHILEMCIEVHGRGIAGSERTLRRLLQDAMEEHGLHGGTVDSDTSNGTFVLSVPDGARNTEGELPLNELLFEITPATQLSSGNWVPHEAPFSLSASNDRCMMSVLMMCQMGLRLFV